MEIRPALPDDAPELADLHVTCWAETYPGLVPAAEIARFDRNMRLRQWEQQIARGTSRIVIAPGAGFAQLGPQREAALAARGFKEELYALYLTRAAQGCGLGRALFAAALGPAPARSRRWCWAGTTAPADSMRRRARGWPSAAPNGSERQGSSTCSICGTRRPLSDGNGPL